MFFLTYDTTDDIISSLEIIEKLLFLETDFWHDNYLKIMEKLFFQKPYFWHDNYLEFGSNKKKANSQKNTSEKYNKESNFKKVLA